MSRVETFGARRTALDWQAHDLEPGSDRTRFKVRRRGSPFGAFEVPLVGAHNVRNALAAIAVATEVGVGVERIGEGLARSRASSGGSKSSARPTASTVYDDFAHHPTAVAETLAGLRAAHPRRASGRCSSRARRLRAAACSRTISRARSRARTKSCWRRSSGRRCRKSERLSVPQLVRDLQSRGQSAREAASLDDIVDDGRARAAGGRLVVVMSNGGFGGIHGKLLRALGVTS